MHAHACVCVCVKVRGGGYYGDVVTCLPQLFNLADLVGHGRRVNLHEDALCKRRVKETGNTRAVR